VAVLATMHAACSVGIDLSSTDSNGCVNDATDAEACGKGSKYDLRTDHAWHQIKLSREVASA